MWGLGDGRAEGGGKKKTCDGRNEAVIKYFKGYVEDKLDVCFFYYYYAKENKSIIGWKLLSHRTEKG